MTDAALAPPRSGRIAAWLKDFLPAGTGLPEDQWRPRHRAILGLLWAHTVGIPVFGLIRGFDPLHVALESAIVPMLAAVGSWGVVSRRTRMVVASVALLSSSAILVHLSGGVIEMHFHFFVMVGVVALYQDWLPFLGAVAYVLVHHGLVGVLEPESVYNHEAAINGPWRWAAIHAGFITAASVAALVRWRFSEEAALQRQNAEERLRQESRIASSLYEVGKILAADLDGDRVVQAVTDSATELTGAEFGAFFYNVDDGQGGAFMLYTLSGAPLEAFAKFGLPRNTPIFEPTFSGTEVVRLDDVTADPRYGTLEPHRGMPEGHLPVRSYLAVPVHARDGSVLGGLFFGHSEVGVFDEAAERLAVGIAAHASVALNNARLYESERGARRSAEVAAHRLAVLSDASRALFASLEPESVFRSVSTMVTQQLADFCVIDHVEEDGRLRRIADGDMPAGASGLPVVVPPRAGDREHPISRAINQRETVFVAAGPDGHPPAAIVVPMIGRHDVLGALTIGVVEESPTAISRDDIPVAEELARRAALAIENARLYARQRSLAETLQHSLLPERLPDLPGVKCAALYAAGGPGVEVGGDWYDVIPLSGGRVGVAIGDVVGRGEKAASLMGQLRNGLRAYALDGKEPAELLSSLNVLISGGGAEHMATMIYGVLDPATGSFAFASAGHPPLLHLKAAGDAVYVDPAGGLPLGALSAHRYQQTELQVSPGDSLILYTDGLVEERTAPLDAGLARLAAVASDSPQDLDAMCRSLAERVLGGRQTGDDMAILALRLESLPERLTLEMDSEPSSLAPLRATFRRWLAERGATEQEAFELSVACGEAVTNAIRHAGGTQGASFRLDAFVDGGVVVEVVDRGIWREARSDVGGRGITIMESYVDSFEVERQSDGTTVRMKRRLACHADQPALT